MRSQGPHGERESGEAETLVPELEQLSVGKRRVVLLFVDPIFCKQPFDQSLRVTLSNHPNRSEGGVKPGHFAGSYHQRECTKDGPARVGKR